MKAVITGPTGMIGTALINKCIQEQIQVLAVCHKDSAGTSHIPQSRFVKVVETDLSEISRLSQLINDKYDVFYHLAWAGTTGKARNDMYLQNENIKFIPGFFKLFLAFNSPCNSHIFVKPPAYFSCMHLGILMIICYKIGLCCPVQHQIL